MSKKKTIPLNDILESLNIRWETDLGEEIVLGKLEDLNAELASINKQIDDKTKEMDIIAQGEGYSDFEHLEREWLKEAKKHGFSNLDQYFEYLDRED